jgi:hypothetical protein
MAIRIMSAAAAPVSVGGTTMIARSQSIIVDLPFAGFVWSRPTEILVERDGHARRVHVVDVTRIAQLGFFGLALAVSIATFVMHVRRR